MWVSRFAVRTSWPRGSRGKNGATNFCPKGRSILKRSSALPWMAIHAIGHFLRIVQSPLNEGCSLCDAP